MAQGIQEDIFSALARGEDTESVLPRILAETGAHAAVLIWRGEDEAACAFSEASWGLLEEMRGRLIDFLRAAGVDVGEPELSLGEENFARLSESAPPQPESIVAYDILIETKPIGGIALAWPPDRVPMVPPLATLGIARQIEIARSADEDAQNRLERLAAVGRVFAEGVSLHRTLARLLQIGVEMIEAEVGLLVLAPEGDRPAPQPIGWGVPAEWSTHVRLRDGREVLAAVLADGTPRLLSDTRELDPADLPETLRALAAVPLSHEGEILGALLLANPPRRFFDARAERQALATLAALAGGAVRSARLVEAEIRSERLKEEIRLAAKVQSDLLPRVLPRSELLSAAAVMIPARNVGGDFYDAIDLGEGRWGFMVADVSGKGLAAALLMAASRSYLHAFGVGGAAPAEVLGRMNVAIGRDFSEDRFLTALYAVVDPPTREIRMSCAGHHPLLVLRRDGTVDAHPGDGLPLGVLAGASFAEVRIPFAPGDLLLIYSDGLVEAEDPERRLFGAERLETTLRGLGGASPERVVEALLEATRAWSNGRPAADDLTLLAVRVGKPA